MKAVSPPTPLVLRTAQRIMKELQSGRFAADEPLPTHRAWAKELMVSHFTVSRATDLLKADGVIESSEGSYAFLLDASGKKPTLVDSPKAEITLWFNDQKNVRRFRQSIVRQRFQNDFIARHPGVSFANKKFEMSFGDYRARVLESFLQESSPTLGEFPQTYLDFLASYDVLGDLATGEDARYLDLLDERYLEHSFVDGKCRFLPFGCSYSYLVCNDNLFRAAGLNPAEEFKSWSDFASKCEQLKNAHGGAPFHVSGDGLLSLLSQWIYQADPALPAKGRLPLVDWQSEAALTGLNFLLEMVFDRKLIKIINGAERLSQTSPFLAGRVPMARCEMMLSSVLELDSADAISIKPFPPGPSGAGLSLMNTVGWAVNANADEATQGLAGKYIVEWERWIHSGEGSMTMRKLGIAPSLSSMFKDQRKDRFYSDKLPETWRKTFSQLKEDGRWEASDSDLVAGVLTPILLEEIQKGRPADTRTFLKHLMLAQYDAGILNPSTPGS